MPFQDGAGGAGSADSTASPAQQALNVELDAIPELRTAFSAALTKLDKQIELAVTQVRVRPWAGDPVSEEAADKFNERSFSSSESAMEALQSYQRQLKEAMDALDVVERQYRVIEDDNTASMNQQGGC